MQGAAETGLRPFLLVVMGVSGSGKTTIAQGICARTGWTFQEGDSLHPPENVAKMASGTPLDDDDRWPWLDRCRDWLKARHAAGEGGVLTCSALKRRYRERLSQGLPELRFVYLVVPRAVLQTRLEQRRGHYMPSSLLQSQLDALEPPGADEGAWPVPAQQPAERSIDEVVARIRAA